MRQSKPTNTTIKDSSLSSYPVIGTVMGLFSVRSRLVAVRQTLKEDEPMREMETQQLREQIAKQTEAIEKSKRAIQESDELLSESQALRTRSSLANR